MKTLFLSAALFAACTYPLAAQNILGPSFAGPDTTTEVADAGTPTLPSPLTARPEAVQATPVPTTSYQTAREPSFFKPLSRIALGAGVGTAGIDFTAATNITPWMNLRATGRYFSYSTSFENSGLNITPSINFKSVQISADLLPFARHSNFHVSPGILFSAENNVGGPAFVPGGQKFDPSDGDYISDPNDPIHGTFKMNLSKNTTAFTLGFGFGNLLPRKGSHWSVPVDLGVAFVGSPTVAFNLQGSVCDPNYYYNPDPTIGGEASCSKIDGPSPEAQEAQADIAKQVQSIQSDLNALKTYPLVSVGLVFNFKIR